MQLLKKLLEIFFDTAGIEFLSHRKKNLQHIKSKTQFLLAFY
jgi:hypothetical protein